jgi:hypothetical protein
MHEETGSAEQTAESGLQPAKGRLGERWAITESKLGILFIKSLNYPSKSPSRLESRKPLANGLRSIFILVICKEVE